MTVRHARDAGPDDDPVLTPYYRELSAHAVMSRDEELAAAAKLARLRVNLWRAIFGHAPLVAAAVGFAAEALSSDCGAALAPLLAAAEALASDESPQAVATFAARRDEASELLAALDGDGIAADRVLAALNTARSGGGRWLDVDAASRQSIESVRSSHAALAAARSAFVAANLRLVIAIARQYRRGHVPLQDLIQEGNLGLMRAVDRFDHRKGVRFSTYAVWWIRHAIHRAIHDTTNSVRLPAHTRIARGKVQRARHEFAATHGREPTEDELAALAGVPREGIERMRWALVGAPVSLDHPVGAEGPAFGETLPDPDEVGAPERLHEASVASRVRDAFARLSPVEADILRERLGLDDDERGATLQEIARTHSISRERIRQIQRHALIKLAAELRRGGLR